MRATTIKLCRPAYEPENVPPRAESAMQCAKPSPICQHLLPVPNSKLVSSLGATKILDGSSRQPARFRQRHNVAPFLPLDSEQNIQRFLLQRSVRGRSQASVHDSLLAGRVMCIQMGKNDLLRSFQVRTNKPPFKDCLAINRISASHNDMILPVITAQKPSVRRVIRPPKRERRVQQPFTGQYLPYGPAPTFLPVPPGTSEAIGGTVSSSFIHDLQTQMAERLVSAPYKWISRLVYDVYESSPFQRNYGYEEFLKFASDAKSVESTPAAYSLLCAGKGAPTQFVPGKARYCERLVPYYQPDLAADDRTLVFESRFECANLRRAIQVYIFYGLLMCGCRGEFEYDLFMKTDYNTSGFAQWFFFKVSNTRKGQVPSQSLIAPLGIQVQHNEHAEAGLLVQQGDEDPRVLGKTCPGTQNQLAPRRRSHRLFPQLCSQAILHADLHSGLRLYVSIFDHKLDPDDELHIASDYPYSYTDLNRLLSSVCTPAMQDRVRRSVLCRTLAGNALPLLVVTNFAAEEEEVAGRPAVILTARVHPGLVLERNKR